MFGSFEELVRQVPNIDVDFEGADLREVFDTDLLLDGNEGWFGGRPGDAQGCFGDSGGPAILKQNGRSTVFGVVSGGLGSNELLCDFGEALTVFGPEAIEFLDREVAKQ